MVDELCRAGAPRRGRLEDYADFARLFLELGVEDPPPSREVWEEELMKRSFFLDGPEGPLAYAVTDVLGREGEVGYVVNLVVAPGQRGQGLGRRMMEALAAHFRARGCRRWMLYVEPDNVPAVALYTAVGMRPGGGDTVWRLAREQVEGLPPAPEGLAVVPVAGSELEALTVAFELVPGKLERFSAQATHRLRRLAHRDEPGAVRLGMMDMRPFAGVLVPFVAATPGHARALLEEAFSELGLEELRVVSRDEALDAALEAAGARQVMRTVEMSGAL